MKISDQCWQNFDLTITAKKIFENQHLSCFMSNFTTNGAKFSAITRYNFMFAGSMMGRTVRQCPHMRVLADSIR